MVKYDFGNNLGEYLIKYCHKHEVTPQEAITHITVWNAAEYYFEKAIEDENREPPVEEELDAEKILCGCGGGC